MTTSRYFDIIKMTALIAALSLAGCSDDSPTENRGQQAEISVKTNIAQVQSRATIINNNSQLQGYDLLIDAYFHGTSTLYLTSLKLHYDTDTWKFWDGSSQLHYYWPTEGSVYNNITVSSLDFVGFCPYTAPDYINGSAYNHTTGASFSCDVSSYMTNTDQASMQEYLIAVSNDQTYASQEAHGGVPLEFKHPFALVKFVIAAESGEHVQVNNISIGGMNTSATCSYDGSTMTWGSHSGSTTMTIIPANPLKYNTTSTETTPMMVIPCNETKTLTINGTWDDWSNVTKDISADVSFNWEPGYIYTYHLTVTKYALKVDKEKFTEQW